jgi:pyrroline-5-carboxylate reductase
MSPDASPRIGFLGAGKMATALARGWLGQGLAVPECLLASDPLPQARQAFIAETGAVACADNQEVVAGADVLIIAVKPQTMGELLKEVRPAVSNRHFIVSVAAGVSLTRLEEGLGAGRRLARVMPNTPCLVGASAAGYTLGAAATPADAILLERLLNAVGRAFRLPEHLLDPVTGLSSSGPAFVALVIEALSDGGVRVGLPREVATILAAQTVLGTAKMVLEAGLHPGILKDMVASAGGTTIAGIHALERAGVRGAFMDAVEAATRRSVELGKGSP